MQNSKLAPSKSTVYVSNLPFSLTNNDLHKVFEKYGRIVKVTVMKNRERQSRGVAFLQFLAIEDAEICCKAINETEMFGRTLKASIAKDNGRATEFIKKRKYTDRKICFECGSDGHLSYNCPGNILGEREPPKKPLKTEKSTVISSKRIRTTKDKFSGATDDCHQSNDDTCKKLDNDNYTSLAALTTSANNFRKKKFKKSSYLSDDEEEISD